MIGPDHALSSWKNRWSRYGGEEFLIVLPGCDLAEALEAAERVRQAVAEVSVPGAPPSGTPLVTVSLGVATGEGASLDADALIRTADQALYRAKRAGRNRVAAAMDSAIQAPSES